MEVISAVIVAALTLVCFGTAQGSAQSDRFKVGSPIDMAGLGVEISTALVPMVAESTKRSAVGAVLELPNGKTQQRRPATTDQKTGLIRTRTALPQVDPAHEVQRDVRIRH
jgi:hypothetical protein